MKTRFLGNSGLRVSTLSLGTMTFGGTEPAFAKMGNITGKEADRFVGRAIDAGINLFDTADAYSAGESERVLGEAIKPYRDRALIATKAFARMGDGPNNLGNSRHHLIKACEASLRRLGTDHIDLYQVHGQDLLTPVEETIAALDSLVTSGKVRYIGCSNHSGWFLMKSLAVADYRHTTRYVAQQIYYSLLAREAEHELIPLGLDQGVGVLVWSPLSGGLLSGKFRRERPDIDGSRTNELGPPGTIDRERLYAIVDVLDTIAAEHNANVAQIVLAWTMTRPGVTSVIIGARNEAQLEDNLRAAEIELSAEQIACLNEVSDQPQPYPYWHQRQYAGDRHPLIPAR